MRASEAATAVTRQRQLAPHPLHRARGSEYAQLSRQIRRQGCWSGARGTTPGRSRPPPRRWPPDGPSSSMVGDSWWQLAVAAFLAVVFTQIGFLGHDAGHRQIFGSRRASYVAWRRCSATWASG